MEQDLGHYREPAAAKAELEVVDTVSAEGYGRLEVLRRGIMHQFREHN